MVAEHVHADRKHPSDGLICDLLVWHHTDLPWCLHIPGDEPARYTCATGVQWQRSEQLGEE
jgi:hypothetical protein